MPVEVRGVKELKRALGSYEPDLKKNLNNEVRAFLTPVVKSAKAYVPNTRSGLSNWFIKPQKKITKKTSAFRRGSFPFFNANQVKSGIKAQLSPTKPNRAGFITNYAIVNTSAAGAIYETAGRANPGGRPTSHEITIGKRHNGGRKINVHSTKDSQSNNPGAGLHFINSMAMMKGKDKMRGRLIYKAWAENEGRALKDVIRAVEKTAVQFHKRATVRAGFKEAA